MVHAYWSNFLLSILASTAVIKLLFKTDKCYFLKNWHPISLLTLTYKIIAKILVDRLQSFAPTVVDLQKMGFIKGHSIQDNFLAFKFAQEFEEIPSTSLLA